VTARTVAGVVARNAAENADGIAIVEAPDSLTMAGISAAIRSTGTVRSETHELFSTAEIRQILDKARLARENFTQPGQA